MLVSEQNLFFNNKALHSSLSNPKFLTISKIFSSTGILISFKEIPFIK